MERYLKKLKTPLQHSQAKKEPNFDFADELSLRPQVEIKKVEVTEKQKRFYLHNSVRII